MFISTIIQHNKKSVLRLHTVSSHRNVSSYASTTTTTSDYITWVGKSSNPIPLLHEAIKRCSKIGAISEGKASHGKTIAVGLKSDTLTSNMIVNMYSKCGLFGDARKVFDGMPERSMVTWNTMIGSLAKSGDEREALEMFSRMHRESKRFSEFTISSVLCACAGKASFSDSESRQLHCFAVKTATDSNVFVATALVDVYAKNGHVSDSVAVFESMPEQTRTPVSWSSMLAGLVQNGSHEEALSLFRRCPEIDAFMVSSAIRACSGLASILEGAQVHAVSIKSGFVSNQFVACSLVDMYGKCGALGEAYMAFLSAEDKTVICWNAVIAGFARHARSLEAMVLFEKMQMAGVPPNEVTYVSVLSACGHAGLVESGKKYFELMTRQHGISPMVVHFSAMVDILARAGLIDEAHGLIESMPFEPTPPMWGSLLASCRAHGNVQLAERAAERLLELEPENAGNRVLLSNVYAASKKWDLVARTRKGLRESDAKKEKGKSWIEVKSAVHSFTVGDRNHSKMVEIYDYLEELVGELKKLGYTAKSDEELHDVEESEKSELLSHHSEKLALAFGLMCLPPNAPIRIMKNLRICGDCHSFMKLASGFTGREIVVRDTNRFHHFKNGFCSCREFW